MDISIIYPKIISELLDFRVSPLYICKKKMSRKRIIYAFDFTGEPLGSGTIKEMTQRFNLLGGSERLLTAVKRGSLVGGKYYFLESDEFILPEKKICVNPLLQTRKYAKDEFGMNAKKVYTDEDKDEIINRRSSDEELAEKHGVSKMTIQTKRSAWLRQMRG